MGKSRKKRSAPLKF